DLGQCRETAAGAVGAELDPEPGPPLEARQVPVQGREQTEGVQFLRSKFDREPTRPPRQLLDEPMRSRRAGARAPRPGAPQRHAGEGLAEPLVQLVRQGASLLLPREQQPASPGPYQSGATSSKRTASPRSAASIPSRTRA